MTILDQPLTPTRLGGLAVRKVHELEFSFNMMVYGDWGVGKTYLSGQADDVPEMRKVLFVDCEAGTLSLRDFPSIDVVRVTTWDELRQVLEELKVGKHPYQTVVLDSLTEIQKFNVEQIMEDLVREKPDRDRDITGLQEWNKSASQIRRFVRAYRDLPMNTIFTALVRIDRDKMNRPIKMPALSGKLAMEIPGFFDYVFYYSKEDIDGVPTRIMQTDRTSDIAAKSRIGKKYTLPLKIGNPSMQQLYGLIKNSEPDHDLASTKSLVPKG